MAARQIENLGDQIFGAALGRAQRDVDRVQRRQPDQQVAVAVVAAHRVVVGHGSVDVAVVVVEQVVRVHLSGAQAAAGTDREVVLRSGRARTCGTRRYRDRAACGSGRGKCSKLRTCVVRAPPLGQAPYREAPPVALPTGCTTQVISSQV